MTTSHFTLIIRSLQMRNAWWPYRIRECLSCMHVYINMTGSNLDDMTWDVPLKSNYWALRDHVRVICSCPCNVIISLYLMVIVVIQESDWYLDHSALSGNYYKNQLLPVAYYIWVSLSWFTNISPRRADAVDAINCSHARCLVAVFKSWLLIPC